MDARGDLAARMRHAAAGPISYEAHHRRGERDRVPVLVTLTPLAEPQGRPRTIMMQVQDLSQLRRTEERLERAQRLEAVGRLAGGVAHEVNNMMTVVLGFADLMLGSGTLPAEQRGDAEEIRRAAERVGAITRQLLAFSRRQLLQPEVLDLKSVVEGAAQLLRPLLPADIVLDTRFGPGVPGVLADRVQLEQVLVNLAFNARDAMPLGGRLVFCTGRLHQSAGAASPLSDVALPPGDYATMEVTDTGAGMDSETMARIFEPFFTTKEVGFGTGLGLATVYGIVKQTGGYVWVRSAPGEGATFTVCLPAADASDLFVAEQSVPEPAPAGHETVLLVEDESAVRGLAARVLATAGFRVLAAADGFEALELLTVEGACVDVVVTDLVMPEMGGRPLREQLRLAFPRLPVLFMSGYPSDEAIGRGWVDPGDPLLQKPFSAEDLVRAVRTAIDSRRSGQHLSPAVSSDY
jgi:signal transduction histidine kinase/ActR/RegA family two-component response regulator